MGRAQDDNYTPEVRYAAQRSQIRVPPLTTNLGGAMIAQRTAGAAEASPQSGQNAQQLMAGKRKKRVPAIGDGRRIALEYLRADPASGLTGTNGLEVMGQWNTECSVRPISRSRF